MLLFSWFYLAGSLVRFLTLTTIHMRSLVLKNGRDKHLWVISNSQGIFLCASMDPVMQSSYQSIILYFPNKRKTEANRWICSLSAISRSSSSDCSVSVLKNVPWASHLLKVLSLKFKNSVMANSHIC